MRLPAALTRALGRLGNLAALAFVVVLAFQAGQQWEIARGNRLPHFDRTTAGTTWCDRDAYQIALRVGPDSLTLGDELAHEAAHVQQMRAIGCVAAARRATPSERLHREAGALCAEAAHAIATHPSRDVQEFDDVAPQLEEQYGMTSYSSLAEISAVADSACAPFRGKKAKR